MTILIINHYAGGPQLGRELRPYFLAKHWQQAGHQVLIAAADYSHLRLEHPTAEEAPFRRVIGGVDYLFYPTPRYNDSIAGRGRNIAAFVKELWKAAPALAEEFHPQVVLAQSGYPYDFFPAKRIAGLCGAKTVLEVRELWPLHLREYYRYPAEHPSVRFAAAALSHALKWADHVVTVLPRGEIFLHKLGLPEEKITFIPSGIEAELPAVQLPEEPRQLLRDFRGNNGFLVLYCGNLGSSHDLRDFVDSASLTGENCRLALVGNGGHKIILKRCAKELGLSNLLFLDGVEPEAVPAVLREADLLFFPIRPSACSRYGIASEKLLLYLASGRPVLTEGSTAENAVELSGGGLALKGSGAQEVAGGIRLLAAMDPEQRRRLGEKGRAYVLQNHDFSRLSRRYLSLFQRLTASEEKIP